MKVTRIESTRILETYGIGRGQHEEGGWIVPVEVKLPPIHGLTYARARSLALAWARAAAEEIELPRVSDDPGEVR